jgi:uncharacterized membrane protein YkvA (DUF1232 family)
MANQQPDRRISPTRSPEERANVLRTLYERSVLTFRLFTDRRVGLLPKIIPILAAIYFVSPADLMPALLMGPLAPLGVVDDVGVVLLALSLFVQAAPPDVVQEHLRELKAGRRPHTDDDDVVEGHAEVIDE